MCRCYILLSLAAIFFMFVSMKQESVKLLLAGSGWNKIVIIDKNTKEIEWEHRIEQGWECNSVNYTPEGNILFSYKKGAKLINKNHEEIWDIKSPSGCEMQSASVLSSGNFLLAWAGNPAVIMEVDKVGNIIRKTEYNTGIERAHAQFRQVSRNDKGNYLVPVMKYKEVHEISPKGKLIRKYAVEGNPFAVLEDKDNIYWIACGDGHVLMKKDLKSDETILKYGKDDIKGTRLFFVAGMEKSERGGIYVCNWQGHDKNAVLSKSPQVFELNNEGNIIWSLNDNEKFGKISAIDIIK